MNQLCFSIQYGYTASATQDGTVRLLRITDIQNDEVQWNKLPFCNINSGDLIKYTLEPGDILIARTGGTVGKSYLVSKQEKDVVYASYLIRIKTSQLFSTYIKLFLQTPLYWQQLKIASVGTGQPNVNSKALANLYVPIPPLSEQRRIVAKLEELLPLVEEYGKAESTLTTLNATFPEALKKSILQDAVQGKLVPQDPDDEPASVLLERIRREKKALDKTKKGKRNAVESRIVRRDNSYYELRDGVERCVDELLPFEIPESWEWARLGEVGNTNIGLTYKPQDVSQTDGTIVLRSNNIQKDKICYQNTIKVKSSVPERALIHKGDLLICARNGSRALVGKSAIVDKDGMAFGAFMAKFSSPFNEYIHVFLNSNYFRSQLDGVGTETINQITQERLRSQLIPIPPLAEQRRIVAKLEEIFKHLDLQELN